MNIPELRKQIKLLIKKYHPDITNERSEQAENAEITKKLTAILNDLKIQIKNNEKTTKDSGLNIRTSEQPNNELIQLKNQDYLYYKLGIKYYKNIHPNFIYKKKSKTEYTLKSKDELESALNGIILSIYLAEHYFTKVILEYPDSMWRNDSIAKIKLLLKLTKSYENINPNETKVIDSARFVNEMGLKI